MSAIVDLFACFFVFSCTVLGTLSSSSSIGQTHLNLIFLILKVQLTLFFVIRYNGWMDLSWETLWPVSGNYLTPINIFLTKVEHTEKQGWFC